MYCFALLLTMYFCFTTCQVNIGMNFDARNNQLCTRHTYCVRRHVIQSWDLSVPNPQKRPIICSFASKMLHYSQIKKLRGLSYVLLLQPYHNCLQNHGLCQPRDFHFAQSRSSIIIHALLSKKTWLRPKTNKNVFIKEQRALAIDSQVTVRTNQLCSHYMFDVFTLSL